MTSILNILYSLGLIASGLLIGYLYRHRIPHSLSQTPKEINRLRRKLQATALLFVNPIAFGGAIWGLDLNDLRIIALPFLGAFAILLGGVLAYIASELLDLKRKQKGVFVTCGSFTNIGSIGSLVTYILLGEAAVALMPFYKLFETFIYYGIGFPYAKSTIDFVSEDVSIRDRVFAVLTDRFVLVAMSSMIFGLGLKLRVLIDQDSTPPSTVYLSPCVPCSYYHP